MTESDKIHHEAWLREFENYLKGTTPEESEKYEKALDSLLYDSKQLKRQRNNGHWDDSGDLNMRKFTPEEQAEYNDALKKVYKPTRRNRFNENHNNN